ncbi:MAG: CBS domain-containing protein, partial [Gemmatimonadota bacterium]|nr:CBS domain-containing protein [Gemmatimonadota bacterium]
MTEHDILRVTARRPGERDSIQVGEVMTRDLITAKPADQLLPRLAVRAENKSRHLPILEGDRLAGIISIGGLVNACRVVAEEEN